jgi:hypothetical protein
MCDLSRLMRHYAHHNVSLQVDGLQNKLASMYVHS